MGRIPEGEPATTLISAVRRGVTAARWYVGSVMGDNDYQRYVHHHTSRHPGVAPLSEGDYWRNRYAAQDNNPQGRCC